MSRAALSGWYQLPVQGLTSCHLAGKSGSNGGADATLKRKTKTGSLHVSCTTSIIKGQISISADELLLPLPSICAQQAQHCKLYSFVSWFLVVIYLRCPKCLVKDSRVSTAAMLDRAKSCNSGKWAKAALCKTENTEENTQTQTEVQIHIIAVNNNNSSTSQDKECSWDMPPNVCLCLFMFNIYLQGGDSIVVQSGHLFLRQGISCLVTDLKTCVELQHVQQLQRRDINTVSKCVSQCAFIQSLLVCSTWQKRCPSFSLWTRLDRWQLTTKWESSNTVLNQRLVGRRA